MAQVPYSSGRPVDRRAKALRAALVLPLSVMDVDPSAPAACPNVGGQAVIEGVMMRGPARWTVTVRRADGSLENSITPHKGWAKKHPVLGKPFLRGAVVLLESMIIGIKALNHSAEVAASDEENQAESSAEASGSEAEKKPALGFWTLALTLTAAFAMAMGLFVALPHLVSVLLGHFWGFDESSGLFHLIDGLIKFAVFIGYVWAIGLFKDIARVYAYHGAEHKAIYAYEAGDPLTPAMAARHPACHPRCGTAFIFLVLALSILFFAAVFPLVFPVEGASVGRTILGIGLKILLMLPLAGLAYEVTRLASKAAAGSFWRILLWPGMLMQRLTTRTPDDSQLEVALDALEKAVAPNYVDSASSNA